MPSDPLLQDVVEVDAQVLRLEAELGEARRRQRELHHQALAAVCPFAAQAREERFVPLGPTRALVRPELSMRPPHVAGGVPLWEARGQEVRFRLGRVEAVRHTVVDQAAFEALPDDVRALTFEAMQAASLDQVLVGMDRPLKLTARQLTLFAGLADMGMEGRANFNPQGVEGGQRLPGGVWNSMTDTTDIWRALVKRGVLDLVSGGEASFQQYRVNPGPRFDEAVEMLLASDVLNRDSLVYQKVLEAFRPGQAAPAAAPKRLRR